MNNRAERRQILHSLQALDKTLKGPLRDHPPAHSDPVIAAIDRLIEPRWIEGAMHVQRLRALADCEALTHHPDVSAWLRDLANIIQEMS